MNALTLNPNSGQIETWQDRWTQAAESWLLNFNSDRTRRTYRDTWLNFLRFCPKSPDTIVQSDVIAYRRMMETTPNQRTGKPYSQSTINLHLSALSSFYQAAIRQGLRPDNPVEGVKRKAVDPYGKATSLKAEAGEDYEFLAQIDRATQQGKRDYAICLILLTTGVRVSAVANLYLSSLRRQGQRMFMRYINKGGKSIEVELKSSAIRAIDDYLSTRDNLSDSDPLFTATERGQQAIINRGLNTDTARPLSARMIHKLVVKYANKALGKGHGIRPHSLRHTAAINASQHGTVAEVSRLLKHKNTQITTIYLDHVNDETTDNLISALDNRYANA